MIRVWRGNGDTRITIRGMNMLLVKTYLDKSAIHGLGVFAGEVIRKGTKVWRFVDGFDRAYSPTQFAKLPKPARDYIWNYGYRVDGEILLTSDHDHHMNHSDNANTHWHNGHIVATRTIRKGEEITNDYRQFDAGFCAAFLKRKLRVVANNPRPREDATWLRRASRLRKGDRKVV